MPPRQLVSADKRTSEAVFNLTPEVAQGSTAVFFKSSLGIFSFSVWFGLGRLTGLGRFSSILKSFILKNVLRQRPERFKKRPATEFG